MGVFYQQKKQNTAPRKQRLQLKVAIKDQTSTDVAWSGGRGGVTLCIWPYERTDKAFKITENEQKNMQ